jgi:hypothetical protein
MSTGQQRNRVTTQDDNKGSLFTRKPLLGVIIKQILKSKHACTKHDSAINGNCRNQQAHTKNSTHRIPVLVNGLTSMDVSTKNNYHEPESSSQQNREHKIIIIGDCHARGAASNVKHNLNDNYRSSGFVRPGANID